VLKEGEEVEMNCTFIANPEVTEIDWFQNVSKAALRHAFSACVYYSAKKSNSKSSLSVNV